MTDTAPKGNPTIQDVAKAADVSVATVSRVINGKGGVRPKLEKRVKRAMKKLHYHPSTLARNLKLQESRQIGLIIPLLDHPFFSRLANVTEQELFQNDYRAIICNTDEDKALELEYVELLLRQRVDGIIINSSVDITDYIDEVRAQNIPCVLVDRNVEVFECSKVFSDNSQGGYLGMKYLLELGHRRIKVVAPFSFAEPTQHRLRGIREALAEFGLDAPDDMFLTSDDHSFELGVNVGLQVAQEQPRPTAIFALTDVTAVGVMRAMWQLNLRIPEDMTVMGYDGIPLSAYVTPALTTVAQPIVEMGRISVQLLLQHIQNPELPPEKAVLENKLIIRESTAPPSDLAKE